MRVTTGVPELDERLEGGFPLNRSVLICGGIGTGKTTLSLQFLMAGTQHDEAGVLVSVDQKLQHVAEDAIRFGWDLMSASERRVLALLDASPYFTAMRGRNSLEAAQVASDLAQQVRRFQARRLVIDSLTSLLPIGTAPSEAQMFLRSLFFSLEDNLGCTVLMTAHTSAALDGAPIVGLAELFASGLVELKRTTRGRSLVIHKMRGTHIDLGEHPFEIVSDCGIVLCGSGAHSKRTD